MISPRPYQTEMVNTVIREWEAGETRQLVSLPTGAGKTICFAMLAQKLDCPALILAHREELLQQAITKIRLVDNKANVGILRADEADGLYSKICVGSVQTAVRPKRLDVLKRRNFKLLVVDEAHHATKANAYGKIIKELGFADEDGDKEKLLLGVTATAFRGDGKALGSIFDKVVYERSLLAMIRGGYLVDARGYRVATHTNISGVHTTAGDFSGGELSEAINTGARNHLVVNGYAAHCAGRKAIVFCCDIAHSQELARVFALAGYRAKAVWGDAPDRAQTLAEFARGDIQIVCNCNVLTEGFDEPTVSAILMARPTKSSVLYIQMVGRGLRISPGKTDCIVLDFVDNAGTHKLCKLGTLAGDEVQPIDGESLLDAEEKEEKEKKERERKAPRYATYGENAELDLFERSNYLWISDSGGHYKLPLFGETLWLRNNDGQYIPFLLPQGEKNAIPLSESYLSLGYAQGVAEDYIRQNKAKARAADKNARWRKDAPSDKQIETLKKMKIPYNEDITKGDATQMISMAIAQREEKNNAPASSKQKWYMRHKLGLDVPENITVGEARKLIAENTKETAA